MTQEDYNDMMRWAWERTTSQKSTICVLCPDCKEPYVGDSKSLCADCDSKQKSAGGGS